MFCKLTSFFYGFILAMVIPVFAQTYDLPIIFVDTKYHQCLDDKIIEKIPATIRVLDRKTNNVADSSKATPYEIGIKVRGRGRSSSGFPKPNYTIEFHDSTDKDINVSLLGLPPSDDWVLHGPYVDKSMVRNSFGHWLFRQTGRYSPRTKHFDLYINGVYRGVYVLIERIKRGKYRVNVSKLKKTDIEGDNLTGGYILAIDRKYDSYSKLSKTESEFVTSDGVKVILRYPKKDKMAKEQEEYIQNYLNELEALFKDGKNGSGYENYVDVASAVDYILHEELTQNIETYVVNFFMYKPKDKTDDQGNKTVGKITLGPPWDFYLAFKNWHTPESSNDDKNGTDSTISSQYQYDNIWIIEKLYTNIVSGLVWNQPNWVFEMWKDSIFQIEVSKRWAELRSGVWHTKTIDAYLDSMKTYLKNAADRNFKRWPNLGKPSGQNDPDPEPMKYCDTIRYSIPSGLRLTLGGYNADTWEGEFEHVRKTVKAKMKWMDEQLGFTEPASPVVFEPIIHEPDWRAEMGDTIPKPLYVDDFSRLSPTNFFAVNGDHIDVQTTLGGTFALLDLNGTVLYKTRIKAGLTTLKIPTKARNKHWIATLNGKMLNR